ncbi:2381_t:CDS:2, partial [Gigaspora rosea]
ATTLSPSMTKTTPSSIKDAKNEATTLPPSITDPNTNKKLNEASLSPSMTKTTPSSTENAKNKLHEATTLPPSITDSMTTTTPSSTEDAKKNLYESTTLPPSIADSNKKMKNTLSPSIADSNTKTKFTESVTMTTTTPFSPDLAAEKTLNKGTTLPSLTTDSNTKSTDPNKKMELTDLTTLPSMTTTPSSTDDIKKNLYKPTTTPQKNDPANLSSLTTNTAPFKTKTTNSQTPAAKITDATTVPPSMTTGTTALRVEGSSKSPTLAPSVTSPFLYETATSTTKTYDIGSSTPDFPIPHVSKTTESPTSKHEKITDYQTPSVTQTPKPKPTHKDKPFIPKITGSLPIAPIPSETVKSTAPTNDNLPSVIVPPSSVDPSASSKPNTSIMTLNVRLSWPSVVNDPNYPPILFNVLPENIADFAHISSDEIGVSKVTRAPDDSCLADLIVPTSHANKIKTFLSDPNSNFYNNGTEDEQKINKLVNSNYAIALQANSANQAADQNFNSSPNSSSSSPIGAIVVVAVCGSTLLYAGLTALVVRAYKRSKNRASATGQDTYGTHSATGQNMYGTYSGQNTYV